MEQEQTARISLNNLSPEHSNCFTRTLKGVLCTDLAERTFAQIIDGLPVRDNVGYFPTYSDEIADNDAPSPEAIHAAQRYVSRFEFDTFQIDARAAQAFQNAISDSPEFAMRLLELLAVACHDIAALLFSRTQPGLRRAGQSAEQRLEALEGRPTDFMHEDYTAWEQYPQGIADVAGYWTEYHLFGGVVLFDRGDSGADCRGVFLHPVGKFRIFQLSDFQISQLLQYATQATTAKSLDDRIIEPPFPFRAEKFTYRVDPFDAMALNIYRDKYERIIPKERPARCVQRLADFPDMVDMLARINGRGGNQ